MRQSKPTDINRVPLEIKESLSRDQFRLLSAYLEAFYCKPYGKTEYETTVKLSVGDYVFSFATSRLLFDGFELAYCRRRCKERKVACS